jgi:hypothetical protein
MRREGLKVARCTLNVGRQRGGGCRHVHSHWRVCPRRGTPPDLEGLGRGARRGRTRREGMRRAARGDEARGVEGCTLHVERGTTTWRWVPTCALALVCVPAPGDSARPRGFGERGEAREDEARGDEARGDEARGDEARGVEGCTLHVERGTTTWRWVPTCALALACMPAPGDSARPRGFGERGEAREDEARGDEARGKGRRRGAAHLRPDRQRGQWRLQK